VFDVGIRRKKFPVVSGIILFCTGELLGEKCEGLQIPSLIWWSDAPIAKSEASTIKTRGNFEDG
jgi:hypothetical protein